MLRPGHAVALCALALLLLGVVMVNSAGMSVAPVGADAEAHAVTTASILLSRASLYMVLAVGAMAVTAHLPVRRLAQRVTASDDFAPHPADGLATLGIATFALVAVLAMVYVPQLQRVVNGSARWVGITLPGLGQVSVQPSEIVKWGMVLLLAWYAARRAAFLDRFWVGLVPALACVGIVAGAVVLEDLGTGVLITAAAGVVLLAAGARLWHFIALVPLGLVGLAGAILTSPYRVRRIITFIDPSADPQGAGYHMIQSLQTVAGGGGPGRGLGHGLQKFGYLPEDTTDFLFAVICEELGVAGAAVVIALYAVLLGAGLAIVRAERTPLLKLAGLGVVMTIGLQAAINLAVVTGMGPTKGIALPLVSAGGTGWILTAACLGLLVAIDRDHARELESQPEPTAEPMPVDEKLPRELKPRIVLRAGP